MLPQSTQNNSRQHVRVLIADDDDNLLSAMKDALVKAGYGVDTAKNGKEVIKKIGERAYDILLLDIVMPGKGGLETLEFMKKKHKKTMPVLVLSNLGNEKDIQKAKELGADEYFIKARLPLEVLVNKVDLYTKV